MKTLRAVLFADCLKVILDGSSCKLLNTWPRKLCKQEQRLNLLDAFIRQCSIGVLENWKLWINFCYKRTILGDWNTETCTSCLCHRIPKIGRSLFSDRGQTSISNL